MALVIDTGMLGMIDCLLDGVTFDAGLIVSGFMVDFMQLPFFENRGYHGYL